MGNRWRVTPQEAPHCGHGNGSGGWSQTWSQQRQHCCICSTCQLTDTPVQFYPLFQSVLGNTRAYGQYRNYEYFIGKNYSYVSMHVPGLLFVCVSFLSLWCSEKGSNLAGLKTKNFISPDEQLLRYQEPMARLLCSTCCPWITPGDSLLIYGSRNSQQMHREQGKRARKLRVINTARSTQRQVSEKEESLTDARHWKRTGWYKQVVQNSSLWRDCVPESLLSRASR